VPRTGSTATAPDTQQSEDWGPPSGSGSATVMSSSMSAPVAVLSAGAMRALSDTLTTASRRRARLPQPKCRPCEIENRRLSGLGGVRSPSGYS